MAEIVSKNPVNDPTEKGLHTQSTFDLGQNLAQTERFGEISPRFAMEVVPKDKLPYSFAHDLRTYTFKAPFMGEMHRNEDAFFVPAECILPLNWDKIYTTPLHGDDVNAGLVGCTVQNFPTKLHAAFDGLSLIAQNLLDTEEPTDTDKCNCLEYCIKWLLACEMIYSNGSLLSLMGAHLSPLLKVNSMSIDKEVDDFFYGMESVLNYILITVDDVSVRVLFNENSTTSDSMQNYSIREFLELARDGFAQWHINTIAYRGGVSWSDLYDVLSSEVMDYDFIDTEFDLNLARFFAYQIVCAHYYSNDKVDYIYDANLYRQNVYDLIFAYASNYANNFDAEYLANGFTLNGSTFQYDYLSSRRFIDMCEDIAIQTAGLSAFDYFCDYLRLIFGFNRSLRYVDYFTGAKTRPLAVGDVNAPVVSNQVNVVDVTRNIQRQRFLNAVNRAGRRISEYVRSIFGVSQAPDYHNPFFLSHSRDFVGSQEIENTGSDQLTEESTVTSILRSQSGRYQFEFQGDRPGILIGVVYYDIERYYYRGVERLMQHVDRYDMFNPFMQFTGDQDVRCVERDVTETSTFGYQTKYMEYKQRYPQAAGGFVEFLPGWLFLADENLVNHDGDVSISPSFIRSRPSELDKFYVSLTGYSLASYFHFIVINRNSCNGSRPMAFAPSIL